MTEAERQKALDAARDALLTALPDAWAIYVYGSFGRGDAWPSSDLDLAVLLPPGRRIDDLLGLMAHVSQRVGHREVEIVDLRRAGLDLIAEVLREGLPLHVANEAKTLTWEAERMTDYADFQPRRVAILDRYLREPLRSPG